VDLLAALPCDSCASEPFDTKQSAKSETEPMTSTTVNSTPRKGDFQKGNDD
jgi:hypothetical protein